jgi:hypothetical protein
MIKRASIILFTCFLLFACEKDIINSDTSHLSNFESFWQTMDRHYVFFTEKGVDWDEIRTTYTPKFQKASSDKEALALYQEIVNLLNDRHVSIGKGYEFALVQREQYDLIQFWRTYISYEFENLTILEYLHLGQLPNGVMYMRMLPMNGIPWGLNSPHVPIEKYDFSKGIIFDLRDCTGGWINGFEICNLFFKGEQTVKYTQFRDGATHDVFTKPYPIKLSGSGKVGISTPLIVLTNSNTFSMANSIVSILKGIRECTLVGERTGGGGGSVVNVILLNGWRFKYTFSRSLNLSMELIEDGILPDVLVELPSDYWSTIHQETGSDPQLDKSLEILLFK